MSLLASAQALRDAKQHSTRENNVQDGKRYWYPPFHMRERPVAATLPRSLQMRPFMLEQ
jgi:hypothetical protein